MSRKDASFWSEIKSLDERLTRDPDSFCFARLSEVYLKVGLAADALHTARTGTARHPGYLAGQRALAMACNANGLHDESRRLLENVTAVMPEDVDAQKLYACLCYDAGDVAAAVKAYSIVLDFRPDDVQSKLQLDALQHGERPEPVTAGAEDEDEAETETPEASVEEDILDLEEADIVEEGVPVAEAAAPVEAAVEAPVAPHHDPLSTLTLGELYEQQGFTTKALDIYRAILADDQGNDQLRERIARLEQLESAAQQPPAALVEEEAAEEELAEEEFGEETAEPAAEEPAAPEVSFEEPEFEVSGAVEPPVEELTLEEPVTPEVAFAEPAFEEPVVPETPVEESAFEEQAAPAVEVESSQEFAFEAPAEAAAIAEPESFNPVASFDAAPTPLVSGDLAPFAHREADNVVETLDSWLENIRRIKACR